MTGALAALLVLGACDPKEPPRPEAPSPTPLTRPSTAPTDRALSVIFEATGRTRARLKRAVADLKSVGLWRRLTHHLYLIELDSRSGGANVPEDGHLADAYFTGFADDGGGGAVCDIMFFPTAVSGDLARWRDYYGRGLVAERPPSLRTFYGSLLAHELAHCRRGPRGEAVARAWEERARVALERGAD